MNGFVFKINLLYITVCIFNHLSLSQGVQSNICTPQRTCTECIEKSSDCSWCSLEELPKDEFPMCDLKKNLEKQGCSKIIDPQNSLLKIQDGDLSNKNTAESDAVQIKPQEITIKVRPNLPETFIVEFRQAVDYPVDLYYLMDLSNSMSDDKAKLAELGDILADEMGKITTNFRLGFGSFVDKTVAPFVSSHPDKLKEPCAGCASPYSFRNNMALSLDTKKFARKVNESAISGNLDAPEGGFDAIMQAIVCKDQIGWRNESRKLLVYTSDNSYHYAGDGKLGGIVEPNDEKCHLDDDGNYTRSNELDYPSLSQINRMVREHKINLIFAVTKSQATLYEQLRKRIAGSSTGTLDADSSNIVDLVKVQYNKIRSKVEMTDNVDDKDISLTYHSKCLGTEWKETKMCEGLKVEDTVTFNITLEYTSCPKDPSMWTRTFHISPLGLRDRLTVHLEMQCECNCGNKELISPKCNNGTFECGVCICDKEHYGKSCQCDANHAEASEEESGCRNGNDTKVCSGRGTCLCGQCHCKTLSNKEEKYSGRFCECSNFGCDKKDGNLCSGHDHGECVCGVCKCHKGWKGDDCGCRDSVEECKDYDDRICSGHGDCECGTCVCHRNGEEDYFGTLCDDCATCPGKCNELKECVECWLENQHGANSSCPSCAITSDIRSEDKIEAQDKEKMCTFEVDKCRINFKYAFDKDYKLMVTVKSSKDCPEPVPVVAIVSGVSGGVVATGIFLLMLWKILTTIHDRRELAKFEKERANAKWNQGQNPIYVEATSTFQNPAYRGD